MVQVQAIEGGETITKQSFFFYSIKSVAFRRKARRGTAHYRIGVILRGYMRPPYPPLSLQSRLRVATGAASSPTTTPLRSASPHSALSSSPRCLCHRPHCGLGGATARVSAPPPTPLFRSNPASGPLLVLLHRPPPPHSALPPLSPPSPPLPGANATALTADLGVLLRGHLRPPCPPLSLQSCLVAPTQHPASCDLPLTSLALRQSTFCAHYRPLQRCLR